MKTFLQKPILLIIFNRPETTKIIFESIKKAKPSRLFVAADGPRGGKLNEPELCLQTRKITEDINWKCDVKRLYQDSNLGCKKGVISAINWFFENVEEGIILEDDCLPDQSFFMYCSELLEKYRNTKQIMMISGDNYINLPIKYSYSFTKYPHIWGWATWRRAWKKYDSNLKDISDFHNFRQYFHSVTESLFWWVILYRVKRNKLDTWDYQWSYTVTKNGGLSVFPKTNLVENIGFGQDATHTKKTMDSYKKNNLIFPLIHPRKIIQNYNNDDIESKRIIHKAPIHILYNLYKSYFK